MIKLSTIFLVYFDLVQISNKGIRTMFSWQSSIHFGSQSFRDIPTPPQNATQPEILQYKLLTSWGFVGRISTNQNETTPEGHLQSPSWTKKFLLSSPENDRWLGAFGLPQAGHKWQRPSWRGWLVAMKGCPFLGSTWNFPLQQKLPATCWYPSQRIG